MSKTSTPNLSKQANIGYMFFLGVETITPLTAKVLEVNPLGSLTILSSFLALNVQVGAFANYSDVDIEHMQTIEDAKIDLVKITPSGNIIQKENNIVVNFSQNFNSKYYKPGDYVQFSFDNDLRTQEGTLLIPCNSSLIARVASIEAPKWFSRNAKVFMEFTHILLPDGTNIPVCVELANKKYLQEGAKETAGKIAASVLCALMTAFILCF